MMRMIFFRFLDFFINDNHDDEDGVCTKGLGERLDAANVVVPTLQSWHHTEQFLIDFFI